MEHLARELTRLAWQLQRDAEELRGWSNEANQSADADEAIRQTLARIETRLGAVHGQTSELMERVPGDLGQVLVDVKAALLARLEEAAANRSLESAGAYRSGVAGPANDSDQSPALAVQLLSPQERRVFHLCLRSGFLSYRDIAAHLDITVTAAKNLVNRLFLSDRKRPLFAKQYEHGVVRLGLHSHAKNDALTASSDPSEPSERTFDLATARSGSAHPPAATTAAVAGPLQEARGRKMAHVF